jgi:stearoyl-CoA desaturase (Delta-9 desaturase)
MTRATATVPSPANSEAQTLESGPFEGGAERELADLERLDWVSALPFFAVHLAPLLLVVTGFTVRAVVLMLVTFVVRQFCITGGYHRYFAHRTYRLGRVPQFLLAFGGTTAVQKGPLWWAGHHRRHHRFADRDGDVHSPMRGFWWSHVGWILCDRFGRTDRAQIEDFARFPELRFLDRFDWIGYWSLAAFCLWFAGWPGLVLGFFCSTVLLWHSTFAINSLAHVFGRRTYATQDTSRNSAVLAVLTLGEGWHNNHHYYPSSVRNGFRWWQWDPTYYVIRLASWLRIAHDLRVVPPNVLRKHRVRAGAFDIGIFRANWAKASRLAAKARLRARAPAADGGTVDEPDERRTALVARVDEGRRTLEELLDAGLGAAERLARASRELERRQPVTSDASGGLDKPNLGM